MLKKYFPLSVLFILSLSWGCKESNEISDLQENSAAKTENVSSVGPSSILPDITKPTTVNGGMLSYESYFVSKADGRIHGYIISIPKDYNPYASTQYPLLVFLHGAGEAPYNDYDLVKLLYHGPQKEIFYTGRSFPAVMASIQIAKNEGNFNPNVIKEFMDVLTGVDDNPNKSQGAVGFGKYNIDVNRLHLTGLSLGGNGVFKTAYTFPDLLASISEFAGYTGSQSDMSRIKIPTYIRHNLYDGSVSSQNAFNAQSWINAAGASQPVNLIMNNTANHDSWTAEYTSNSFYDWHFAISKSGAVSPPDPAPVPPVPPVPPGALLAVTNFSPTVNSIVPASSFATLTFQFNKPIKKGQGIIEIKNLTDNESFKLYANWGMVSVNNDKATIYPVSLKDGKLYSVRVDEGVFTDMDGNNFGGISNDNTWKFSVGSSVVPPPPIVIPPVTSGNLNVISYSPGVSGSVAASDYSSLTFQFNKSITKGQGLIEIRNITDNESFKLYANWGMLAVNNDKATIYPISLKAGKQYSIKMDEGVILDQSGNKSPAILNDNIWTFTVAGGVSSSAISVTDKYPVAGSTISKPANGFISVVLDFNKTIIKGSSGVIKVRNLTDNTSLDVAVNWGMFSVTGSKASIYPVPVLSGKQYSISIDAGSIVDDAGNPYQGITSGSWIFNVN